MDLVYETVFGGPLSSANPTLSGERDMKSPHGAGNYNTYKTLETVSHPAATGVYCSGFSRGALRTRLESCGVLSQ